MKNPFGLFAAATLFGALAATPASAADFVGPRAEVTVGLDRIDFDLDAYGMSDDGKARGVTYGGAVGYDAPLGRNLVAGLEAGVNFSTADRDFGDAVNGVALDAKRDLELSARLGARVAPRTMLYGKAGYTNLRIDADTTAADLTTVGRTNLDGYRLGLGLEQGVGANTYLKTEYRYSNYEQGVSKNEVLAGIGIRF